MPHETLLVAEASELSGVDRHTLYRAARDGIAPHGTYFYIGRRLYFRRGPLLEWLASGGGRLPGGWKRSPAEVTSA
jgi:hypothetical protein